MINMAAINYNTAVGFFFQKFTVNGKEFETFQLEYQPGNISKYFEQELTWPFLMFTLN